MNAVFEFCLLCGCCHGVAVLVVVVVVDVVIVVVCRVRRK